MILLALLTACAVPQAPQTDSLQLCFGSDGEAAVERESQSWEITGEVTDIREMAAGENFEEPNIYSCWETPELMMSVLDDDGVTWTLGMGLSEAALPALDLAVGAQVDLEFSAVFSFGQTAGAVIEDSEGLIFAADLGNWGRALDDQVTDSLNVSEGERTLTIEGSCGTQEWGAIDFGSGGQKLSLETGERGSLEVDGADIQVQNVGSFLYSAATCTDVAGLESWMAWR